MKLKPAKFSDGSAITAKDVVATIQWEQSVKDSVIASATVDDDVELVRALLDDADVVVWANGTSIAEDARFAPAQLHRDRPGLEGRVVGDPRPL